MEKMCLWCGKYKRSVPINRGPGRFLKQICSRCNAERLRQDWIHILEVYKKKNEKKGQSNEGF